MRRAPSSVLRWLCVFCLLATISKAQEKVRPVEGAQPRSSGAGALVAEPAAPDATAPAPAAAQASVPHLIRFSGVLQNLAGRPITGPVDVTFSLYSEQAGGAPLWFETQTVQADALGHYSALLGAMSPSGVPLELFTSGEAHWLGVMVQGLPEQPRVLLVSVPYALKAGDAETLGGKPASAYALTSTTGSGSTTNPTISGLVQASALTTRTGSPTPLAVTATQNYIPVMTDNAGSMANSVMYQTGGFIGVGTTTPAFPFDLNNNVFAIGPKSSRPGAGGTMRFRDDSGTVRWLFGVPGTAGSQDFFMYNYANGHAPIYIQNGAASYSLYMNGTGNVGIGTTAPLYPLDVNGSGIALGTQVARAGAGGALRIRDDTGTLRWVLGIPGTAGATDFFMYNAGSGQQPFYVQAAAPSNTLYLNSTGNVGVGTASPTAKLEVNGTSKFDQGVTFAQPVTFASSQNFGSSTTVLTASTVTLSGSTSNQVLSATQTGAGAVAVLNNTTGGKILSGQNSGVEKFSIDGSGNVTGGTATLSGNNATQVLRVTQAGTGAVAVLNNTVGGKIISGQNAGAEKFFVDGSGNLSITGQYTGDGSLLTKLDPTKLSSGTANISISGSSSSSGFATGAGSLSGFDGSEYLTVNNDFFSGSGGQTIASGFLAIAAGDLSLQNGNLNLPASSSTIGLVNIAGTPFLHDCCSTADAFVGPGAGNFTATGTNNTGVGNSSLASGTTGSGNTAVGSNAGVTTSSGNANTTGSNNTYIGANSGPGSSTQFSNSTAIGANAVVGASNTIVLGSINGVNGATSGVNVGIGTQTPGKALDVTGDIRVSGCFLAGGTTVGGTCSSDARFKTNVRPFGDVLDRVAELQPVRFEWRAKEFPDYHFLPGESFGLIAQSVQKVFPDMVSTDEHGYKMVNYGEMPYLLLASVRELKTRNDSLSAQMGRLAAAGSAKDAQIARLQQRVSELEDVQAKMKLLEARMGRLEARTDTAPRRAVASTKSRRTPSASSARTARKTSGTEVARVRF